MLLASSRLHRLLDVMQSYVMGEIVILARVHLLNRTEVESPG
jgi:hypothetical protein